MTLILSNEEIAELLPMPDCLDRMEDTYRELGNDRAISRPRTDIYAPAQENGHYIFKTMDGMLPKYEVAAVRLNSDFIRWKAGSAAVVKDKEPMGPGGTWVGLVILFSTRNGEPLAIIPDGVIQQLRVAATQAIGAKYLANPDASVYAQIGSGWQAGGQALAMSHVRKLREIRVYSPTKANRERLADTLRQRLGITVRAVDDPGEAMRGADIVGSATNSVTPVVRYEWLAPGAHINAIKTTEVDVEVLDRCQQVVLHTQIGKPANYVIGRGQQPIYGHDPKEALDGAVAATLTSRLSRTFDQQGRPDITQIVSGKVQAAPAGSLTCFLNNMGHGVQFAALGALACERAKERGIGRSIPTEWLLQTVHS
jgi:ornithine cyclodeaminase/alanine dehydrogenase-like protein (mu-crystallin family)